MNWLHYLLEANLYLAVFYAGYYLFLRRETYYTLNRFYLLFGSVVSFILPVMQLGMLKPAPPTVNAVHFAYTAAVTTIAPVHTAPITPAFTLQDAVVYGYLLGAIVLFLALLFRLYQLLRLTRLQNQAQDGQYKIVYLNQSDTAFSFFNYLFIGTKVEQAEMIIKHELVHIRQKHSADVIFIELLKIVNWFNPFIYLMQHSLRAIHEYIADEKTASEGTDTITYSSFLVNNAYGLGGSSITHSFFNYNLLKKRIIMLHQKRSGSLARLKYLLAIPICGGLLCASTLAFSKTYGIVDLFPQKIITPQKPRYDVWNKSYDHTFTTSNGYKVRERVIFVDGAVSKTAEIIDKNGQKHFYDDKTISPKDRKSAEEKYGYQFPIDTVTNAKLLPPPPPPAPPVKRVKFPLPKTSKGYQFSEYGYTENGKSDIVVTIQEKDGSHKGYDKNKATATDLALLKEKYGYVFPAHLHVPPPPPTPPTVHELPSTPEAQTSPPTKVHELSPPPPPAPPINEKAYKMPPPPPLDRCFFPLYDYMAGTVRYPANAKQKNITGNVVVSFKLNSDNKITDVKLVDAGGNGFDEEVIKALNACTLTITGATARPYYMLGVSFNIVGGTTNLRATSFGPDITDTENYACVVQLNGYTQN